MAKAPNLDELREQARSSYRYWHIYLMLRLREVEQHLAPSEQSATHTIQPNLPSRKRGKGVFREPR